MAMSMLREKRQALGLTLQEVARGVGIAASNLSRYERGKQNPRAATAVGLYQYFKGELSLEAILNAVPKDQAA